MGPVALEGSILESHACVTRSLVMRQIIIMLVSATITLATRQHADELMEQSDARTL